MIGGSADLTHSSLTRVKAVDSDFTATTAGRYVSCDVRELLRTLARPCRWSSCFLPVEIVEGVQRESGSSGDAAREPGGTIEIDVAGGHRMRISGRYDPEALARLIRGLSG